MKRSLFLSKSQTRVNISSVFIRRVFNETCSDKKENLK